MTRQETFDKAVGGVIAQGRLARNDRGCKYRVVINNRMLKCVAGQLIPDEKYDPKWDQLVNGPNKDSYDIVTQDSPVSIVLKEEGHDVDLVQTLQIRHDNCHSIEKFILEMQSVAKHFNLEWKF